MNKAREIWDIWSAEPNLFNAPNEVIADRITARVEAAFAALQSENERLKVEIEEWRSGRYVRAELMEERDQLKRELHELGLTLKLERDKAAKYQEDMAALYRDVDRERNQLRSELSSERERGRKMREALEKCIKYTGINKNGWSQTMRLPQGECLRLIHAEIMEALSPERDKEAGGFEHEGCNYLAAPSGFCNKCGWLRKASS